MIENANIPGCGKVGAIARNITDHGTSPLVAQKRAITFGPEQKIQPRSKFSFLWKGATQLYYGLYLVVLADPEKKAQHRQSKLRVRRRGRSGTDLLPPPLQNLPAKCTWWFSRSHSSGT